MYMRANASPHRGQGLVEFALILPALLLVVVGIVELGRFMFIYTSVHAAAREAARYGAAVGKNDDGVYYFRDCNGIEAAARRVAFMTNLSSIEIQYDYGDPAEPFSTCPPPEGQVTTSSGARIHVTVQAEYHPFFFFQHTVTITADSARTIVRKVEVSN